MRKAEINRKTKETDIQLLLDVDGTGQSDIQTGIGFLDHMLTLFAFHSKMDLTIHCKGDVEVDSHHTTEDIGIALGQALQTALGDKTGIARYGSVHLPMDETLALVAVDLSGRSTLVYNACVNRECLGSLATEDVKEFFKAVADNSLMTLHLNILYGANDHHKIEALFKGFGRALRGAVAVTSNQLESTKGVL